MINRAGAIAAIALPLATVFLAASGVCAEAPAAAAAVSAQPSLTRIRIATIAADDIAEIEARYTRWLGYLVRERGKVPSSLARSWGAPKAAGRPYLLLSSPGWPNEFIRAVQTPAVKDYRPMTTYGWNAIELIVDDPDVTREEFRASPFEVIGGPANLEGYPTIRAFQVTGSANEVLYLTAETGDRSKSILPLPLGPVGRTFIMVLAGPDIEALRAYYAKNFRLTVGPARSRTLVLLQKAQDLPRDRLLPITTTRLAVHGNLIEFDGYSEKAGARPRASGELPPGVAMASFGVASLADIDMPFIARPAAPKSLAYGGKRAATVIGPAGELIELIEE